MVNGSWLHVDELAREREGSALIVALWVVGLLSMLVTCFAFDAHIESRITSYYRKRRKAEYLARSGIEIAELLMNKSEEMQKNKSTDEDEQDQWHDEAKRLAEGLAVRGFRRQYSVTVAGGQATKGQTPNSQSKNGAWSFDFFCRRSILKRSVQDELTRAWRAWKMPGSAGAVGPPGGGEF